MSDAIACLSLTLLPVVAVFWAASQDSCAEQGEGSVKAKQMSPGMLSRCHQDGGWLYDDMMHCVSTCAPTCYGVAPQPSSFTVSDGEEEEEDDNVSS